MHDIKKYAVIVAGGKGLRMGNAVPKQFLPLCGMPVLAHSIFAFASALPGIEIILVLPEGQLSYAQMVLAALPAPMDITLVTGGGTRFHSVQRGLAAIKDDGIVFIHDGARPLISKELILRCCATTLENGNAIPAIAVAESLREINGAHSSPLKRDQIRIIQTPQTFFVRDIVSAFCQDYNSSFTDEATVAEAVGLQVHLVEGDRRNIKITTEEDMVVAGALMGSRYM